MLLTDLEHLGESALAEFNQQVAELARDADPARQVERLEAKLEQLYAVAVTVARREESLEQVEAIWARMVVIAIPSLGPSPTCVSGTQPLAWPAMSNFGHPERM